MKTTPRQGTISPYTMVTLPPYKLWVLIMCIDHIPSSIKQLNQRESFGIYKLQATKYPGLNEDMDLQTTGH
jgi:hypothetical protein